MVLRDSILLRSGDNSTPPIAIVYGTNVFSMGNIVAKVRGNFVDISSDLGANFTRSIDCTIVNKIRFIHIFSNGKMLVGNDRKLFFTNSSDVLVESSVLDIDGNTFNPILVNDNFTNLNGTRFMNFGGSEVLCWGNYNNNENTNNSSGKAYVWFTEDFGATVKCVFKFGTTLLSNGTTINCRHIHGVVQNPEDGTFWIETGDEPTDTYSHWIKGIKNGNSWSWQKIASGSEYKTTGMIFKNNYIYCVRDIGGGGVYKIPVSDVSDQTKFIELVKITNDPAGMIIGKNGEILIHQYTYLGPDKGSVLYYSENETTWHRIEVLNEDLPIEANDKSVFHRSWNPNNGNKVLCAYQINGMLTFPSYNFTKSVWLDDIIHKYGFPNAFK